MQKTILTVDDSATMRQSISLALEKEGYKVVEARDGKEALGRLNGEKFHVILVDVNMPGMDGITLTRQIRGLPNYKYTPIIIVTTESQAKKKEEGKGAGATGWIVKPFKPDQLLQVIKKVCP